MERRNVQWNQKELHNTGQKLARADGVPEMHTQEDNRMSCAKTKLTFINGLVIAGKLIGSSNVNLILFEASNRLVDPSESTIE